MLSALVTRLRGYFLRREAKPYQPDFSDASFFNYVSQRDLLPETLKQAAADFSAARSLDARLKVLLHFRSRANPRFFVDFGDIPKLAEEIRQKHPTWHAAQRGKIESDCDAGLAIYSATAPPLKPGFPWHAPAQGYGDDLLYPVRPHRFAFAPRMAMIGLFDESLVDRLGAVVDDWLKFAQKGESNLPYVSNLVVIQRLLALCWAWAFLAARPHKDDPNAIALEWALIKIIRVDVEYLVPRLGTSFPNNHLLVDRFAGWYIAQWLPEFCNVGALSANETEWLKEIKRQTLSDGTGFEHSVHYHEFGCEMAVAYYLLAKRNQREIPLWFEQQLAQMLSFQADLSGRYGLAPAIGNATEDPLFPLDASEGWASAAWWAIHRELFDPGRIPLVDMNKPCIERAIWLLGKDLPLAMGARITTQPCLQAHPEGGFFVFCESDQSSRLTFRTGPGPMTPISAGHMHADLLSLSLTVESESVLMDAGTYTYRNIAKTGRDNDINWRQYLAGPLAHNGPTVEHLDPLGVLSGDFRPSHQTARVKITRNLDRPAACWVEATIQTSNDYDGMVRGVVFIPGQYFLVYDTLPKSGSQLNVSYGFQFSPTSIVFAHARSISGNVNGQPWEIDASPGLNLTPIIEGSTHPLGGWVSTRYGDLVAAPQARFWNDRSRLNTSFLIRAGKQVQPTESAVVDTIDSNVGSFGLRISFGKTIDYFIIQPSGKIDAKDCWGIDFDGDLLWLRTCNSRAQSLRWLDGRSVKCQHMGLRVEAAQTLPNLDLETAQPCTLLPSGVTHCELG